MPHKSLVVVGSLNIDYIATVERLPAAGETVFAAQLARHFGGKGANQAIAAARQGAKVKMIGCVGADDDGQSYCVRLKSEGIDIKGTRRTPGARTGTALIAVDRAGENTIIVAPGANEQLSPSSVRQQRQEIFSASLVLMQMEIPLPSIVEALRLAERASVPVVLNPSPLRKEFPWGKHQLRTLIVNVGEAQGIFNLSTSELPGNLGAWRGALRQWRIEQLLITRGAESTIYITETDYEPVPTLRVKPLDTVGAGDAFAGAFAARMAAGTGPPEAIRAANCAGALATLKSGAQESIPYRAATDRALRHYSK